MGNRVPARGTRDARIAFMQYAARLDLVGSESIESPADETLSSCADNLLLICQLERRNKNNPTPAANKPPITANALIGDEFSDCIALVCRGRTVVAHGVTLGIGVLLAALASGAGDVACAYSADRVAATLARIASATERFSADRVAVGRPATPPRMNG